MDELTNTHTLKTKPLHQLGFFTMKCRGLYKSRYDLQQAIHSHRPDILVFTETKLKISESRLWLDGAIRPASLKFIRDGHLHIMMILVEEPWFACAKR